jgi:hypothetical protein
MTDVRTGDEAIATLDHGLTQWSVTVTGVLTQAGATVAGAATRAADIVRKWAIKTAAVEARLGTLKASEDSRQLQVELAHCRQSLNTAREAASRIDHIAQQVAALRRTHAQRGTSLVTDARADLLRRSRALISYRSAGMGPVGGDSVGLSDNTPSDSALARVGLGQVDVDKATFEDNPIIGEFGRGDTTRADYRWAVETWDAVVGPGVSRGMAREDFERRDADRGAGPLRRTAAVYDMFLGETDRILVGQRSDGTFDVTNGRHRLEVARELGIRSLPGKIVG